MTMFYTPEGGEQVVIPEEHEKVLAQYRDSMPLVWEPQGSGDPYLYPLIDEDTEPPGTPRAGEMERSAELVAWKLRHQRLGGELASPPDFEALLMAAARARIADYYEFAHSCEYEDGKDRKVMHDAAVKDTVRYARRLGRAIEKIARELENRDPVFTPIEDPEPQAPSPHSSHPWDNTNAAFTADTGRYCGACRVAEWSEAAYMTCTGLPSGDGPAARITLIPAEERTAA